jgi:hypothetical protein
MSKQRFNATDEIKKVRQHKAIRRRKSYQQSRLAKLRTELVLLRKEGASYREITLWLRSEKRVKTTHTTVMRYLEKLPEMKGSINAEFSECEVTSKTCGETEIKY